MPCFFEAFIHTLIRNFHEAPFLSTFSSEKNTSDFFSQIAQQLQLRADAKESNPQDALGVFRSVKEFSLQISLEKKDNNTTTTPNT